MAVGASGSVVAVALGVASGSVVAVALGVTDGSVVAVAVGVLVGVAVWVGVGLRSGQAPPPGLPEYAPPLSPTRWPAASRYWTYTTAMPSL
ncbi:MAG: hypothetical protein HC914_18650, partial [Chloroflexaceae bacterium]|nr:hypothetical protein [Chloroflexaceae bacterium]